jgi:formate dehydrogenase iron-sulfur subunit
MIACPYGIPRYDWDKPAAYVQKCDMCIDRIREGKQPACTEACPTDATIFGDRDELIKEAHRRIREHPEKYVNKIFGEFEVGGTSVLYVSDIDIGFLTHPLKPGIKPLPETTSTAMEAVPFTFVGMGALMAGIFWICRRREELQSDKQENEG